jgi:hypothetical protein
MRKPFSVSPRLLSELMSLQTVDLDKLCQGCLNLELENHVVDVTSSLGKRTIRAQLCIFTLLR